jgi:hypothetical protein
MLRNTPSLYRYPELNAQRLRAGVQNRTQSNAGFRASASVKRWDEAEHIKFRVRFIEPVVYRALEKQVGGGKNLDDHANTEPPFNRARMKHSPNERKIL